MPSVADAAAEFLSQRRIAVAGVSREAAGHGGNTIYTRLRERGYEVFAVNPNADMVEGDRCYRSLAAIPGGIDGVVIATNPADSEAVVHECMELGIERIWIHRLFGAGSESPAAVDLARAHRITAIVGGCPLMFGPASDRAHACLRWFQGLTGGRPIVLGD